VPAAALGARREAGAGVREAQGAAEARAAPDGAGASRPGANAWGCPRRLFVNFASAGASLLYG